MGGVAVEMCDWCGFLIGWVDGDFGLDVVGMNCGGMPVVPLPRDDVVQTFLEG